MSDLGNKRGYKPWAGFVRANEVERFDGGDTTGVLYASLIESKWHFMKSSVHNILLYVRCAEISVQAYCLVFGCNHEKVERL
jgi:hypothetical protein